MNLSIYSFPALFAVIANTCIGFFVFIKSPKKSTNRTFFAYCLVLSTWVLGCFGQSVAQTESQALFWDKVVYLGCIFTPVVYVHFIFRFLNWQPRKNFLPLFYFSAIVFQLINLLPPLRHYFVTEVVRKYSFRFIAQPNILWYCFLPWFNSFVFYVLFIILSTYKKVRGDERNKIKYLLIAYLIMISSGSLYFLLIFNIPSPPIDPILLVIYCSLMAYLIVKYQLMDIRVAVTRASIFVLVYTLVLGIPFYFGYKYGLWMLATWITVFFASAGPFVFMFFRRRAEEMILKEQRQYQHTLRELAGTMTRIRDIDQLMRAIVLTVVNTVRVPFSAVYLKEEESKDFRLKQCYPKESAQLAESIALDSEFTRILLKRKKPLRQDEVGSTFKFADSGLVIPFFMEDELLGFLVLGAKPKNQMYTPDDVMVFETLSYSASLAIENCRFWREIEDRQRKARLQEMDTFAYSLAHEIDNPMTIILNLSKFLKSHFLKNITDEAERKDVEETCSFIVEASDRVSGMVKAIRQFGQKGSAELVLLHLQDVIEGFCRLYAPEMKGNSIFFSRDMPETPIYVKGVAVELQQILMIFARNAMHAMKFSENKKIVLTVRKVNSDTVRIGFSDSGYGVKQEKLQTIFAPFVTTKASTEGTGMGLYNAKGFVIRHKGRIWAESDGEGAGATFFVELPIVQENETLRKPEETNWQF